MNPNATPPALQSQVSNSSFYAGMRVLPKAERQAMYAIYAFCRAVDDVADDQIGDRAERAAELDAWRTDIDALYSGRSPGRAAFLSEARERFDLDRADFHAVIDGMAMDVARDIRGPDASELDLYCDRVASAVGRLSVRVFGMERAPGERLSHHLGRALQLTNILRDIDEDAAIGRVYLPRELLEEAGIALTSPIEIVGDPRIDQVARKLASQARAHYDGATALLKQRPRGRLLAPRLMAAAYGKVLARMEAQGWSPPRQRVRVSKPALLWTMLWLSLKR
jgi:presqualene diphosphate synthase